MILFTNMPSNAQSSCDLNRFAILSNISEATEKITLTEFMSDKEELEDRIAGINEKIQLVPFEINLNGSVSHNTDAGKFDSYDRTETAGISGVLDLNLERQLVQEKILNVQQKLLFIDFDQIEKTEANSKIITVIEIIESNILKELLNAQALIYDEKLEFFEILSAGGERRYGEIVEAKFALNEIDAKITALNLKLEEKLFYLGVSSIGTQFSGSRLNFDVALGDVACDTTSYEIRKLDLQIELLNAQLRTFERLNEIDVKLSLELNQTSTNSSYSDELNAAFSMSFPLFDGGNRESEKKTDLRKLSLLKRQRDRAFVDRKNIIAQRLKTERVLQSSLRNIENEKDEIKQNILELKARAGMGQSVFLELKNKSLEFSKMLESEVRLKSDFLTGWVNFLGRVDGIK